MNSGILNWFSQSPIKITPEWGTDMSEGYHIKGWIIRDDKGNKYYFGQNRTKTYEAIDHSSITYTADYSAPPPSAFYTATWHLVEMTDVNNLNAIKFTYSPSTTYFETLSSGGMALSLWNTIDCQPDETYSDMQFVETQADEKYLTLIEGGNDSLIFYSSSRSDCAGAMKLDSLRLFAKNGKGLRKRYHFNYSYFGSGSPTTYYWRLKLKGLSELPVTGTDSLAYRFEYIENVNLPSRFSSGLDYWGYYNGKTSNWIRFPNGVYRNLFSPSDSIFISNMGDRRADANYAQANTLKKIVYPTGGYREFIYEANKVLLDYWTQVTPDASFYNARTIDTNAFNTTIPWLPEYQRDFTINSTSGGASF